MVSGKFCVCNRLYPKNLLEFIGKAVMMLNLG